MPPETLALLAEHRATVGRMLTDITDDVLAAWVRAWSEIEQELIQLRSFTGTATARVQLERARDRAAEAILDASFEMNVSLTQNARVMLERGLWEQPQLIASQLPAGADITLLRPPSRELDLIVQRTTEQITARSWALSQDATAAMHRALTTGMAAGVGPARVAERIIEAAQTAFDGGLARAMVIARTEMIDAHRIGAELSQQANTDVLAGWYWWAQLGPRTCPSCIEQHGRLHPIDEPGPLDHHQGRCARVPKTRSWRELGFDIDEPNIRAPQDGQAWFRTQPETVQRNILGPKRYEAWKAGDYPRERWSVRRTTDGWRPSYHVGPLPN